MNVPRVLGGGGNNFENAKYAILDRIIDNFRKKMLSVICLFKFIINFLSHWIITSVTKH